MLPSGVERFRVLHFEENGGGVCLVVGLGVGIELVGDQRPE